MKKQYKHAWVTPGMLELKKKKKLREKTGSTKVTKTKGVFKKEEYEKEVPHFENVTKLVSTGKFSQTHIDIDDFSVRIENACNALHESGYDVLQIIPTNRGDYDFGYNSAVQGNGGWGYGYGYSVTGGVIIIGKLRE